MRPVNSRKILAEQKINAALTALGLSFAEGFRIVRYNPEVSTAVWKYYPKTGNEVIEIGDLISDLPVGQIEMALRHEFLHRSVFHGFGEQYDDPQVSNIVLDICINRLLTEAFPREMKDLSVSVYPTESKTTLIALADCSADPFSLKEPLRSLWKFIWEKGPDGQFQNLNPASLYFRLIELHDPKAYILNPFSDFSNIDPGFSGNIPDSIVKAGSRVAQDVSRKLPKGSSGGDNLNQYSVIPQQIGAGNVERFLNRISIKTIASAFSSKIKRPLQKSILCQTYPMFPSRIGYIYQVCGLTDVLKLYWNQDLVLTGVRLAIGFYIDVSGSMVEHFPLVSGFVDSLKEYPIRMYCFDTSVREIDIEEFRSGKLRGGGGTDFNCIVNDFVQNKELAAALIFTDGYGDLSETAARALQYSRKKLYLVYLKTGYSSGYDSVLGKYATDSLTLEAKDSRYIVIKKEILWKKQIQDSIQT